MSMFSPVNLFAVLGPLFLVLGASRCLQARALTPQGRTWLILGLAFSAVAAWLRWQARTG